MLDAADDHLNLFEWNLIFLSQLSLLHPFAKLPYTKLDRKHNTNTARTISIPLFLSTLHLVFFNITICDIFSIDIQISTELWVDLDEIHQLFIHGAYYIQCFASLPSGLSLD